MLSLHKAHRESSGGIHTTFLSLIECFPDLASSSLYHLHVMSANSQECRVISLGAVSPCAVCDAAELSRHRARRGGVFIQLLFTRNSHRISGSWTGGGPINICSDTLSAAALLPMFELEEENF